MQKIVIDGVTYSNVGNIEPEIETEYYYDVTTLNGKHHQKIRYQRTNFSVNFFNLIDGVYSALKAKIKQNRNVALSVGIPADDSNDFDYDDYYVEITGETFKGYLSNGQYKTNLTIKLTKEMADE